MTASDLGLTDLAYLSFHSNLKLNLPILYKQNLDKLKWIHHYVAVSNSPDLFKVILYLRDTKYLDVITGLVWITQFCLGLSIFEITYLGF